MFKKNIAYFVLFLFFGARLLAQPFGNEWIVHSQNYYKIKIGRDGLYRLDSTTLAAAGVPLASFKTQNIQLFHKGQEIPAYVFDRNDSTLNTSDYILFYAEKNTMRDDSLYFHNIAYLTNPFYSVINDTSAVFFTWNNLTNNKRLTLDTDTNFSQSNPSPYYWKELHTNDTSGYSPGPKNYLGLSDPRFEMGECMMFSLLSPGTSGSLTFNGSQLYTAGPAASFTVCISGANDISGVTKDHIAQTFYTDNTSATVQVKVDTITAYNTLRNTFSVSPSVLLAPTINVGCAGLSNPYTAIEDNVAINHIRALLPHKFDLLGTRAEKMWLPDDGQAKSKIMITGFDGTHPILVNVTDGKLHTVVANGGSLQALVANSPGQTKYCYFVDSLAVVPATVSAVNGTGKFADYSSLIKDSNFILVYHPKLDGNNDVTNYKNYRSSPAGGSNSVIAASVLDLYDQFGYGVDISPMAIRRFCAWVINDPGIDPKALFLLGKSVHSMDCIVPDINLVSDPGYYKAKNLVPTWGNPSSDVLITQGLPGSAYLEPAIPTGRLSAQTPADVQSYFNKVLLYEQQTGDSLWKKRALHFVGGKDHYEQQALSYYTNAYKRVFEDTSMGGDVYSFYKVSTAPTTITTNDSVKKLIEDGVLLMTFFGHGSQTGFDQNIDDPQNYNNSPKFPLIIGNSCYTGDIHSGDQLSNSEVFMLAPNNKGTIGFLATVSEGVANYLYYYTDEFYKQFCAKNYGRPYSYCIKKTINKLIDDQVHGLYPGVDSMFTWTTMEMTFHGDPEITAYNSPKPDYSITNSDIILDAKKVADSLRVKIVMTNLAKAVNDSFVVSIIRTFPNGDTLKMFKTVKGPYYKDTLSFSMKKEYYRAVGQNCISVELDYYKSVTEINEANNKATACIIIPGSDINPIWPYKYAIVPDIQKVTLKASTADPFAPMTNYRIQVDTNDKFLLPMVNQVVSAPGGVVSLPVTLYNRDSMVYFWRVCKDDNDTLNWKNSSFQVINGKYGWGQSHFEQFKEDAYQYVVYSDTTPRRFKFVDNLIAIKAATEGFGTWSGPEDYALTGYYYNNAQMRLWTCASNGWTIAVFDSVSAAIQYSDTLGPKPPATWDWLGSYNNCVCNLGTRNAFDFGSYRDCQDWGADWRSDMVRFIDSIHTGDYVLAYTVKCFVCGPQDSTNTAMLNAFHSLGSMAIDSLKDTTLMILFGRKGMLPGQAHEVLSTRSNEYITLNDSIPTHFNTGYIASEIIGPCMYADSAWKSLHWKWAPLESNSQDSIKVRLVGIDATGHKVPLFDFRYDSLNVLDLPRYVNGKQFPYLQLIAFESDDKDHTAPQMIKWQVIYDPAPEAAIDPPAGFQVFKSSVAEGENYKIRLPIRNTSDFDFPDSLVVTYMVQDAYNVTHTLPYTLKNRPFKSDSVIFDTITVSTLGYAGADVLWVDVNPPSHKKYQPEQYHFNNIAQISFNVDRDKVNPLLDVTFDGVHILNGDIVSAKPNILIGLRDENRFLALNDTGNFMVYLQSPGSSTETRLFFKDALQFIPAQLPNNSCKINYKPVLAQDGVYQLRVTASDRSKNASGQVDYKIQFDIVNKPTITEVLNYPNPFSTSTRFVFTITGSEVPETFKVQILTISGRVVKEITREELGFLHIGRNITEYAWDGKDQFGDQLANGVYLYHVDTRLNGNEIEHKSTEADSYFKKGFGKMLLMR